MSFRVKLNPFEVMDNGCWYTLDNPNWDLVIKPDALADACLVPDEVEFLLQRWGETIVCADNVDDMLQFLCWFYLQELMSWAVAFRVGDVEVAHNVGIKTVFKKLLEMEAE